MVVTTYDLLKECFDEIKTCDPMHRQTIIKGYAASFESREIAQRKRAIDECIRIAKRNNASQELLDELAALYGYAKADRA